MAITGSGFYGKTLEKFFIDTAGFSLEAEDKVSVMMVRDASTPDFDADDFRADVDAEVTAGSGYTAGGQFLTGTELTVASPAAGQIKYDATDAAWAASTITAAMAAILYYSTGNNATDQLVFLSDFVTAATSSNGTFTVQWAANGIWYLDYVP